MRKISFKGIRVCLTLGAVLSSLFFVKDETDAATRNFPAKSITYKIHNKSGGMLSEPITVTGRYIHFSGGYETATPAPVCLSDIPALVTAQGNSEFTFHMPADTITVTTNGTSQRKVIANVKITGSSIRYIRAFSSVGDKFTYNLFGSMITSKLHNPEGAFWKQPDDSYMQSQATPHPTVPNGYFQTSYGMNLLGIDSYGNASFSIGGENGDVIRFEAYYQQIKEIFEDTAGTAITPPTGYSQNKLTDITSDPYTHTMTGGSSLPKTYVVGSNLYTYQGWYKGDGNQALINTSFPPNITFSPDFDDSKDEVHIVYDVKAARTVTEQYIDESSVFVDPSWNGTSSVPTGSTFTQTPADPKTDSGGVNWEYQGWKLSTEPMSAMRPKTTPVSQVINANTTIQYVYKKKQHTLTERIVDVSDGTTLIGVTPNPNTVFTNDNDTYTKTPTATLTDYSGDNWNYDGWENVTDAPGTVNSAVTPVSIANVKGNKEIKYHYRLAKTTATLDLTPNPQLVGNGGTVNWASRLTNTGLTALKDLKLKATSNWASGLSHPTQVTVTPASGAPVNFTISPGAWTSGFNLTGISIPNSGPNNYADITFTDTATGAVNQVLPAEIEIDGNMASPMTAENFVRIDDPDEPNLKPTGNAGLINLPDFRFGDVEVKPYAQTKGLDSSSYQAGYNPYIRYMDQESLSGWSLTTKLGQFTSGSKTLPTTTTIQLKNGDLKEVQNYNKHNESLSSISSAGNKSIPSDSTTVSLTNGGAQGVYQLDYSFNDVELDLLAHSGVAGLSYTATMDWTLTTAP